MVALSKFIIIMMIINATTSKSIIIPINMTRRNQDLLRSVKIRPAQTRILSNPSRSRSWIHQEYCMEKSGKHSPECSQKCAWSLKFNFNMQSIIKPLVMPIQFWVEITRTGVDRHLQALLHYCSLETWAQLKREVLAV